jgi:hypothetical protein
MKSTTLSLALAGSLASVLFACAGDLTTEDLAGGPDGDPGPSLPFDGGVGDQPGDAADLTATSDRRHGGDFVAVADSWPRLEAPDAGPDGSVEPGDASSGPPPDDAPLCNEPTDLFRVVNPGFCDCTECPERDRTTFTLAARSRVLDVWTYVQTAGLSGSSFGYSIAAPDGAVVSSGAMYLVACTTTTGWCFFSAEMDETLDAGAYVLGVDWPRICSNPESGGQGFVIVKGCAGS